MIFGIGVDALELNRFEAVVSRVGPSFFDRICTENEKEYCESFSQPNPHYAARFAAKEALSKALGVGIGKALSWLDIEIRNSSAGQPMVFWHIDVLSLYGITKSHISITHSKEIVIAFAILES